ncbi:MAG TPA: hypothetical protein VM432_02540, partial [Bdellovibrionales bacterium]|nr:hypothetical protein [Bdellovibrionales bacterium]
MKLLILVLGLTFSVVSFAAKDKKRMPASPSPEPTEISEKMDAKLKALSIHRYDCSADLTISSSGGLGSFDTKDSQTVFARSEA